MRALDALVTLHIRALAPVCGRGDAEQIEQLDRTFPGAPLLARRRLPAAWLIALSAHPRAAVPRRDS